MLNRTLLFGEGLFETIRWKPQEEKLKLHYERLKSSAEVLGIPYPTYEEFLIDLQEATGKEENLYVKYLLISKGGDLLTDKPLQRGRLIITKPLRAMPEKVSLCLSPYHRHSSDPVCRHKTTSYLFNLMVKKYSQSLGFWDGIVVNEKGYVCECSTANLLFLKGSKLYTPARENGLLWGTTLEFLSRRIPIEEDYISLKKIEDYDGLFVINSLLPCAIVESFEGKPLKQDLSTLEAIREIVLGDYAG
ncbi:MAG: aminotransferase class IV [Aquificaceae bacterium]